jgi:hypothetical protein
MDEQLLIKGLAYLSCSSLVCSDLGIGDRSETSQVLKRAQAHMESWPEDREDEVTDQGEAMMATLANDLWEQGEMMIREALTLDAQ